MLQPINGNRILIERQTKTPESFLTPSWMTDCLIMKSEGKGTKEEDSPSQV